MSNTATAKQQAFYAGILAKCVELDSNLAALATTAVADFASLSVADASAKIVKAQSTLAALQEKVNEGKASEAVKASFPIVPVAEGHYALDGKDGALRFYEVNTPDSGKWAGFTFLSVCASDERYPIKGDEKTRILREIAQDPQAAMKRYGQEIGKCGHCGRTLTDETSRANGIGPVCNKRMGWA